MRSSRSSTAPRRRRSWTSSSTPSSTLTTRRRGFRWRSSRRPPTRSPASASSPRCSASSSPWAISTVARRRSATTSRRRWSARSSASSSATASSIRSRPMPSSRRSPTASTCGASRRGSSRRSAAPPRSSRSSSRARRSSPTSVRARTRPTRRVGRSRAPPADEPPGTGGGLMGTPDQPRVIVKKKRTAHAAPHGGAWKVAYADFVTAMMALFIVLWLLTQADVRLRQQIAQYFRQPGVLASGTMIDGQARDAKSEEPKVVSRDLVVVEGDGEQELLEGQKKAIEDALKQAATESADMAALRDQVIIQVTDAGLSIQVVDKGKDLLFDLSSARLKPALVELLKRLAAQLGRLPNHIQIGGHTDSRPFAPDAGITNWELAFARANAARRVLETNGLWNGQIHRIVGYADSEPLVPENPLADENRRLSILAERRGAAQIGRASCRERV